MNVAEALQYVNDNYTELENIINDEYLYEDSFLNDMEDNGIEFYAIYTGASKGVIIPFANSDYVIKIPFNYDDYSNEYYDYNYCDLEYENYKRAIEYGVADFFAEIKPLINIDGFTIYVQTRVAQGLWNSNKKYQFEEAKKKINDIYGDVESDCPTCTIALLIDNYGELKVLDFLIFISEHDINDLTDNNIGLLNGDIKILDYSGFFPM
jgi:hypothetical protein